MFYAKSARFFARERDRAAEYEIHTAIRAASLQRCEVGVIGDDRQHRAVASGIRADAAHGTVAAEEAHALFALVYGTAERLDRFNGLILGAGYDAAFNCGLISFTDDGKMIIAPSLDRANFQRLGLTGGGQLAHLSEAHIPYIQHHRRVSGL